MRRELASPLLKTIRRLFLDYKNVMNLDNNGWKTGKYELFLGEELGLHDSMNRPYPQLFDLFKRLKSLDWAEDEIELEKSRLDFLSCDKNSYDVMIKTLSFQYEADSLASRSIISLFAPFISNSDLSQMMMKWSENEALHALTYSEIIRQCIPVPDDIFEEILADKNITDRSRIIAESFSKLKMLGAKYTLDKDSVDRKEVQKTILLSLSALYCLEALEFMASFSCTFSLAERDLFEGVASLVQKIMIDEQIHSKMDEAILDILLADAEWLQVYEDIKPEVQELVDSVYTQELSWSEYIFEDGRSILGLTTPLLKDWVTYKAEAIYDKLSLVKPFKSVKDNPLKWMDKWEDIDSNQQSAQEVSLNNYRLNSVIDDIKDELIFDFGSRDKKLPDKVMVYSKEDCPYCIKIKDFLDNKGVLFEEVDVTTSGKDYLVDKGFTTVPQVFTVDGNYLGDCTTIINNYG